MRGLVRKSLSDESYLQQESEHGEIDTPKYEQYKNLPEAHQIYEPMTDLGKVEKK